jgi:subtilisin family serine protease
MRTTLALVLALAACAAAKPMAPLLAEDSASRVPGEYVVIFEETVTDRDVFTHVRSVRNLMSYHGNKTNFVKGEYHIGSFRGYGAMMDDKLRDIVRSMDHVQYVECSQYYHTMQAPCENQGGATWGIVRTTFTDKPTVEDYSYNRETDGSGVVVYIIDTGIDISHPDFEGRAFWGADFIDNPSPGTDLNGHGTHVAGTVMSNPWGLARGATAIAVRVLDQNGFGSTTGIDISHPAFEGRAFWGADFIDNPSPGTDLNGHGTHVAGTVISDPWGLARGATAIAVRVLDQNGFGSTTMSLGGGFSAALNDAVDAACHCGDQRFRGSVWIIQ